MDNRSENLAKEFGELNEKDVKENFQDCSNAVVERKEEMDFVSQSSLSEVLSSKIVDVDFAKSDPAALEQFQLHASKSGSVNVDSATTLSNRSIPKLKIVMLAVGTRGDVQPFIAVAKKLQEFGHQVRLATHVMFSDFVKSTGVNYYPLGGDPRLLAEYMARNKGLPLSMGELAIQRQQFHAMMDSILPACTGPDIKTGAPFRAEAMISNPPAFGQMHVAEALGIPVHLLFTVPWTPTCEFPSPIAHLPQSPGNKWSYLLVDLVIWWVTRSRINAIREGKLKLAPIPYFSTYYGSLYHLPMTYMWSQYILPKPKDWGPSVDVVGYCFLNLESNYQPPEDLVDWMKRGPRPIYVGFGSMLLDDQKATSSIVLEALKSTGQRGILDSGWGDLGSLSEASEDIFLLQNCPHDWLFRQCAAVVHHGGGGTTAAGLKAGCPTTVVPFWGDQYFWADKVCEKGLGPEPIPIDQLTVESLSNAIRYMLQPEVKSRAVEIAQMIEKEDGVAGAVDAFHRHLPRELPMPPTLKQNIDHPSLIQRFFVKIGTFCCRVCA